MPSHTLTPIALAAMELLHEGPKHPYEIHQAMQERESGRLFKLTTGSLYHAIDRLARDGLIEAVETSREGRRPERTTYRLTDTGRDVFAERLRAMIAEPSVEYPRYSVAISMLHELKQPDALVQLRRRALTLEAHAAAERLVCERLSQRGLNELYWAETELRLRMREAELSWTRRMIERIERRELSWPDDEQHETARRLSVVHERENTG